MKQKYNAMSLELEKSKRIIHEQNFNISDLNIKIKETEQLKTESSNLSKKIIAIKNEYEKKEKEYIINIETLKHQKSTIERELISIKEKNQLYLNNNDQNYNELLKLRIEYDAIITDRDRLKRQLIENENNSIEQHIIELKNDLNHTSNEYYTLTKEKQTKDNIINKISAECSKEREKVTLLKLQITTLEDKLRIANQELSVYRGIDVYHSSMQAQLTSYRKDRSFQENNNNTTTSTTNTTTVDKNFNSSSFNNSMTNVVNNHYRNSHYNPNTTTTNATTGTSTSRPHSRSSSHHFAEQDSEDEGNYTATAANRSQRTSRSGSPTGPGRGSRYPSRDRSGSPTDPRDPSRELRHTSPSNLRVADLMKPSSPILRPAVLTATAPARSNTNGNNSSSSSAHHNTASRMERSHSPSLQQQQSQQQQYSQSLAQHNTSTATPAPSAIHSSGTGRLSMRDMEVYSPETRSVASEPAAQHHTNTNFTHRHHSSEHHSYVAEEEKTEVRPAAAVYDSNVFSFTRPLPKSPLLSTAGTPSRNDPIIIDDLEPLPPRSTAAADTAEQERQELLRRRAERKALRDQQLRQRILREGTRGSTLSSSFLRTTTTGAATAAADVRDQDEMSDVSSDAGAVAASRRDLFNTSIGRRHTSVGERSSSAHRPHRSTSPVVAEQQNSTNRFASLSHRASTNATHSTTTAAAATATRAGTASGSTQPYRPAVPDYARARKLLNM